MRLIDADVFKKNMDYVCDAGGWLEPVTTAVTEYVKKHIDAQTTVDAEPVIRCKDCKYWKLEHYVGGEGMACQFMPSDGNVNLTEPTEFCCWAERKEK